MSGFSFQDLFKFTSGIEPKHQFIIDKTIELVKQDVRIVRTYKFKGDSNVYINRNSNYPILDDYKTGQLIYLVFDLEESNKIRFDNLPPDFPERAYQIAIYNHALRRHEKNYSSQWVYNFANLETAKQTILKVSKNSIDKLVKLMHELEINLRNEL
jgi:hypothetical protein